jgi:hypothetical protein
VVVAKKKYTVWTEKEVEEMLGKIPPPRTPKVTPPPMRGGTKRGPRAMSLAAQRKARRTMRRHPKPKGVVVKKRDFIGEAAAEIDRELKGWKGVTAAAKKPGRKRKRGIPSKTALIQRAKRGIAMEKAISYRYGLKDKSFAYPIRAAQRIKAGHGFLSTAIASFYYIAADQQLFIVWWKDWTKRIVGSMYVYFDVQWSTYEALVNAPSKGRYTYYNIRTSFRFRRLS